MFGNDLAGLKDADLAELAKTIPTVEIPRGELEAGIGIIDLLVRVGGADSKGAARRLVTQGGAYINNVRITSPDHKLALSDLATETMLVVRAGKKDYRLVRAR